jgi:hypothetical protein
MGHVDHQALNIGLAGLAFFRFLEARSNEPQMTVAGGPS